MMTRITQERLNELRATTPHASLDDLRMEVVETDVPDAADIVEDVRSYLRHYAAYPRDVEGKVIMGNPCLGCGENLGGNLADQLLTRGGFTWGLAHGHGYCQNCGWPATLYHFIKDRNGADLCTVRGILLQVHPDDISLKEELFGQGDAKLR